MGRKKRSKLRKVEILKKTLERLDAARGVPGMVLEMTADTKQVQSQMYDTLIDTENTCLQTDLLDNANTCSRSTSVENANSCSRSTSVDNTCPRPASIQTETAFIDASKIYSQNDICSQNEHDNTDNNPISYTCDMMYSDLHHAHDSITDDEPPVTKLKSNVKSSTLITIAVDMKERNVPGDNMYNLKTGNICASIHQGSEVFPMNTRGRQCTCNSVVALCHLAKETHIAKEDLDLVLYDGNILYRDTVSSLMNANQFKNYYLSFEEIPTGFTTTKNSYTLKKYQSYDGFIGGNGDNIVSYNLRHALMKAFRVSNTSLFLLKDSCMCVFKSAQSKYCLFDPHSRTPDGKHTVDGTAVLLTFDNLAEVHQYFIDLDLPSDWQFELMPVKIERMTMQNNNEPTCSLHTTTEALYNSSNQNIKNATQSRQTYFQQYAKERYAKLRSNTKRKKQRSSEITREYHMDTEIQRTVNARAKHRYHNVPGAKRNAINRAKEKYRNYPEVRKLTIGRATENYRNYPEVRKITIERAKERYKNYPEVRKITIERAKERYKNYPEVRKQTIEQAKENYRNDPEVKKQTNARTQKRYRTCPDVRRQKSQKIIEKYRKLHELKKQMTERSKMRYKTCPDVRKKTADRAKLRYKTIPEVKRMTDMRAAQRKKNNPDIREQMAEQMKRKYRTDAKVQQNVRERVRMRSQNPVVKLKRAENSKQRYNANLTVQRKKQTHSLTRHERVRQSFKENDIVVTKFHDICKEGPEYICCSCHRLLFRSQLKTCHPEKYEKTLAKKVITKDYHHVCRTEQCESECLYNGTTRRKLWICFTCENHIKNGNIPPESQANGLKLEDIPEELETMNTLERQLIALRIPFTKVLSLPKGGQRGVKGPVVCVPSKIEKTTDTLPRPVHDAQIVGVKLKRKLQYKSHYEYKMVNITKMHQALEWLKNMNPLYTNVSIDTNFEGRHSELHSIMEENENLTDKQRQLMYDDSTEDYWTDELSAQKSSSKNTSANANNDRNEVQLGNSDQAENDVFETNADNIKDNSSIKEKKVSDDEDFDENDNLRGVCLDSCMQPLDLASEAIAHYDDLIYNVAPAEGEKPVSLFKEKETEGMAFPVQFPSGTNTLNADRPVKLSHSKYFNARLLSVDTRFACDPQYLFYAQYCTELTKLTDSISVTMRQGSGKTNSGQNITAGMLANDQTIRGILKQDQGFRFMQPIRGSPQYWQRTMNELFAMIRQLGIPTWFATFSCAELSRWPEVIETIAKQKGETVNFDTLTYQEKCDMIRSNPVTAVRMFDHRVKAFVTKVIRSPAKPIGDIVDYFYRVEFQQRGAPHIHCLFWDKEAPLLDRESDDEITQYIDKYVTCQLPDETEPEMRETVLAVQMHRKKHTKSCKKGNKTCRFNFPKPPSEATFINRPHEDENKDKDENTRKELAESIEKARKCLQKMQDYLTSNEPMEVDCLTYGGFQSFEDFKCAMNLVTKKTSIVMKRTTTDAWVNNYNAILLKAWNANMDIQFVLDPYSCIMYIVSYISKAEKELGELMKAAREEIAQGNENVKKQMRKLGFIYFENREMSAQEAVVRVCGLHMKDCSREVVFVPTDEKATRMSLPLAQIKAMSEKNSETTSVWMPNMPDKYKARPETPDFNDMCLAKFASEYRSIGNRDTKPDNQNVHTLSNGLGKIQKRTHSQPAVIRYAKFSEKKNPEKYYTTLLKLYLPYRNDKQLKPQNYDTCESFYKEGAVKLPGTNNTELVSKIVAENQTMFDKSSDDLDNAWEDLQRNGPREDAWATIAPETENERIESEAIRDHEKNDNDTVIEPGDIPDLNPETRQNNEQTPAAPCPVELTTETMLPLMRCMNAKQRDIFYHIRQWCLEKVHGKQPEPFNIYVGGGAGVGKSHLIKCISFEARKILKNTESPDDITVLLTAPTGTAAFNINGSTLHSVFKLPIPMRSHYEPLGDDMLTTLRAQLHGLTILIIDEISMVNAVTLMFVHSRLKQLKNTHRHDVLFGNVCILAVGDFYQLPPVMGRPLCVSNNMIGGDMFSNFALTELTEIMRQGDDKEFAGLLNRLRTKDTDKLSTEDESCLQSRTNLRDVPKYALHVYARNADVDKHNKEMLEDLAEEKERNILTSVACDYSKDKTSGRMIRKNSPQFGSQGNLPMYLKLCIGARVMLLRNLDVSDGLVNGVVGTVMQIKQRNDNDPFSAVIVKFDNDKVGSKQKIQNGELVGCVQIEQVEEKLNKKNASVMRRQIPMRLSWASTIHKTQGMTVDQIVVSLGTIFQPGQAYVALSRVTSLQGLYITDYKAEAIYCDEKIARALQKMTPLVLDKEQENVGQNAANCLMIAHHNVQGLILHLKDVMNVLEEFESNVFMMTETWLSEQVHDNVVNVADYVLLRSDRQPTLSTQSNRGGVALYVSSKLEFSTVDLNINNMEYMATEIKTSQNNLVLCIVIYRPPGSNLKRFCLLLTKLLKNIDSQDFRNSDIVIAGDFNEDLLNTQRHPICDTLQQFGFAQHINSATTKGGTLLDAMYVRLKNTVTILAKVVPTYFSYHEATTMTLSYT